GQNQANLFGTHHPQHIQQVAHVEADLERTAAVFNRYLLLGFFLLRVIGLNLQQTVFQLQPDTAIFFVRKNSGTAKSLTKQLSISHHELVTATWQHALVVRKFPVNEFRSESEIASVGADMMLAEYDTDITVLLSQQTSKLQNTFARHDYLVTIRLLDTCF